MISREGILKIHSTYGKQEKNRKKEKICVKRKSRHKVCSIVCQNWFRNKKT